MDSFKSAIYNAPYHKKPSNSNIGISICLLIAAIGWLLIELQVNNAGLLLGIGIMGATLSLYLDIGKTPKTGEPIGALIIDKNGIEIMDDQIDISDIREFSIDFRAYKKQKVFNRFTVVIYEYRAGTENTIALKAGQKEVKYHFMIRHSGHRIDLINALEHYYEAGIFVKEAERTYLGKELAFEEVQAFKKKYRLKGNGY